MKMEKSKEEAQRTNGEHVQERGNNTKGHFFWACAYGEACL
jgi:hypothetical protein